MREHGGGYSVSLMRMVARRHCSYENPASLIGETTVAQDQSTCCATRFPISAFGLVSMTLRYVVGSTCLPSISGVLTSSHVASMICVR